MLPYIVTFISACFLLALSENHRKKNETMLAGILAALALMILCGLAGARSEGVGTDTGLYGAWLYALADQSTDLASFMHEAMNGETHMELLFALQAFVVVKLTGSVFCYYFVIELLMLLPIYLALREFESRTPVWLSMGMYLALFYIPGLNLMRQYVAMGFALLAFVRLYAGRSVSCWVLFACAFLFHTSALIGLVPLLGWLAFFKRAKSGEWQLRECSKVAVIPVAVVVVLAFFGAKDLLAWMTSLDTFSKYRYALSYNGGTHYAYYLVYGVMMAALASLMKKVEPGKRHLAYYLLGVSLLAFPINALEVSSETLARMAAYMLVFTVLLFSVVYEGFQGLENLGLLPSISLGCVATAFVFFYVIKGVGHAVPYATAMFGG